MYFGFLYIVYMEYNNANNQQDATTFSFINLFNSALHVPGDKFAHPQEHFFGCIYIFWYNAASTLLPTAPVGRSAALYQKLYISQKVLPRMGEFFARNM